MTINVYKNVGVQDIVTIQAGMTESNIYDCTTCNGQGAHSLRRITLYDSFTPGNINFLIYRSINPIDPVPIPLSISDFINRNLISVVGAQEITVAFPAYAFDSVFYFSIKCDTAQILTTDIHIILQPIYQGAA